MASDPRSVNLGPIPSKQEELWRYTALAKSFQPTMVVAPKMDSIPGAVRDVSTLSEHFEVLTLLNGHPVASATHLQGWTLEFQTPTKGLDFLTQTAELVTGGQQWVLRAKAGSPRALLIRYQLQGPEGTSSGRDSVVAASQVRVEVAKGHNAVVVHELIADTGMTQLLELQDQVEEAAGLESLIVLNGAGEQWVRHRVQQAAAARMNTTVMAMGGRSGYVSDVDVVGEQTETALRGLGVLRGSDEFHYLTRMDLRSPQQSSEQTVRMVLDGSSRGVFRGEIQIHADCPGTRTAQLNQNLLLSQKAEVVTLPRLLIDTDDVKATHGATVGQLQEEEIFYLQSRGISRHQAQRLVVEGFARDVVSHLKPEQKELVQGHLERWFGECNG